MSDDTKLVFAKYEVDGDPPTIVIGIPKAAWEYMKDGKTHHFDLTRTGVPVQLVLFGGDTHESVMTVLTSMINDSGKEVVDARDQDFGIKRKS